MTPTELTSLLKKLGLDGITRRGSNIMACCPSHSERRPSWGISVNGPHHWHGCFACDYKGTLRTLLLDQGWSHNKVDNLLGYRNSKLETWGKGEAPSIKPIDEKTIWPFTEDSPEIERYLVDKRKLSPRTLKRARVLWDRLNKRIVFPWYWGRDLIGATGRTIIADEKQKIIAYGDFKKADCLYVPDGRIPRYETLVLVEGEIDALKTLEAVKFFSVAALGHGRFSKGQVALIKTLPVKTLILFFDNDRRGKELMDEAHSMMKDHFRVLEVNYKCIPKAERKKDPGAMSTDAIKFLLEKSKSRAPWSNF